MSVVAYQNAVRILVAARHRIREIAKTAAAVAASLEGWDKANPLTVNGGLDAAVERWPSRELLALAIREWKDAAKGVATAWEAIPPEDRLCLTPPESLPFKALDLSAP